MFILIFHSFKRFIKIWLRILWLAWSLCIQPLNWISILLIVMLLNIEIILKISERIWRICSKSFFIKSINLLLIILWIELVLIVDLMLGLIISLDPSLTYNLLDDGLFYIKTCILYILKVMDFIDDLISITSKACIIVTFKISLLTDIFDTIK